MRSLVLRWWDAASPFAIPRYANDRRDQKNNAAQAAMMILHVNNVAHQRQHHLQAVGFRPAASGPAQTPFPVSRLPVAITSPPTPRSFFSSVHERKEPPAQIGARARCSPQDAFFSPRARARPPPQSPPPLPRPGSAPLAPAGLPPPRAASERIPGAPTLGAATRRTRRGAAAPPAGERGRGNRKEGLVRRWRWFAREDWQTRKEGIGKPRGSGAATRLHETHAAPDDDVPPRHLRRGLRSRRRHGRRSPLVPSAALPVPAAALPRLRSPGGGRLGLRRRCRGGRGPVALHPALQPLRDPRQHPKLVQVDEKGKEAQERHVAARAVLVDDEDRDLRG